MLGQLSAVGQAVLPISTRCSCFLFYAAAGAAGAAAGAAAVAAAAGAAGAAAAVCLQLACKGRVYVSVTVDRQSSGTRKSM